MPGPFDGNPFAGRFLGGPSDVPAECDACGRKVDMTVGDRKLPCPTVGCGGQLRDPTTEGRAA